MGRETQAYCRWAWEDSVFGIQEDSPQEAQPRRRRGWVDEKVEVVPSTIHDNAVAVIALPPPPPAPPSQPDANDQSIQERKKSTDKKFWKGHALVMKVKINRSTSGLAALTTKKSELGWLSVNRDVEREGLVAMDGSSSRSCGIRELGEEGGRGKRLGWRKL